MNVFRLLGISIYNWPKEEAVKRLEDILRRRDGGAQSVFFVNAHTLNLAHAQPDYQKTLNDADFVFGDGTGVRWGAKLHGVRVRDNLNGTDFVPTFLTTTAGEGYRYFLLGSDEKTIEQAAKYAEEKFPRWSLAGFHSGYFNNKDIEEQAIEKINAAKADVLLVGMGNPIQERWIAANKQRLNVSLCFGVGGLFDFWAGNVERAPAWLRRIGHEWIWRLLQQPADKAKRYLLGNPLFLERILCERYLPRRFGKFNKKSPA